MERVKTAMHNVAEKGEEAAAYVGHRADDAVSAVGEGLKHLGSTVREKAPHTGVAGDTSEMVADKLENSGRYLQEQGLTGIGDELTNLIRRNPIPALLVGVGVGYLIAHMTQNKRA